mgnify:CR=1 FL=1
MSSGYIEYANGTGTTINATTYVGVAMTTPSDAPALVLPTSGVQWSHLEIGLHDADGPADPADPTHLNATEVLIFLSWDSLGVQLIAGPMTTASKIHTVKSGGKSYGSCAIDLGIIPTFPASNPAGTTAPARGTIYCWVKADSGTDDKLILARMHWNELSKG